MNANSHNANQQADLRGSFGFRPRSGLNENSPALQRWVAASVIDKSVKTDG